MEPEEDTETKEESFLSSPNPIERPLRSAAENLNKIDWELSKLYHQIITAAVLAFMWLVLLVLYYTVGPIDQVASHFHELSLKDRKAAQKGDLVEKATFTVTSGFYFCFYAILMLPLLPFLVIGWLADKLGFGVIIILALALVFAIPQTRNRIITFFTTTFKELQGTN